MTLAECRAAITSRESQIESITLPVRELHAGADTIAVGPRTFSLGDGGLRRFARRVRAPWGYIQDVGPSVRALLLQYHLDRGDLGEDIALLVRNGRFLASADPNLHRMTGGEVLDAVLEAVGRDAGELNVDGLRFFDESFELDLLGYKTSEEVLPGDIVSVLRPPLPEDDLAGRGDLLFQQRSCE
jgi:hypothetical protein